MSWDYAELSKAAKAVGGPENLIKKIEEGAKYIGRIEGRSSMIPWIGVTAVAASALTAVVMHLKSKKAISQAAEDEAKAELIQGIKDYDAEHPEEQVVSAAMEESD